MATLQRTQAIPLNDYPSGTFTSNDMSVPDAATVFYFEIQRCTSSAPTIWPNQATTFALSLDISLDNGQTWNNFGSYSDVGGILFIKDTGVERAVSSYLAPLPAGTQRKLHATVTIANEPLRTQGFYEARA